jgi:hypothetical protein
MKILDLPLKKLISFHASAPNFRTFLPSLTVKDRSIKTMNVVIFFYKMTCPIVGHWIKIRNCPCFPFCTLASINAAVGGGPAVPELALGLPLPPVRIPRLGRLLHRIDGPAAPDGRSGGRGGPFPGGIGVGGGHGRRHHLV